jgi:hypothetical protein
MGPRTKVEEKMEDLNQLNWNLLVKLEPRLGQLHLDCRFADKREPGGFDRDLAWNGTPDAPGLKQRLEHLVGAQAEGQDPRIQSNEAYQIASTECFGVLPPNRAGMG